MKLYMLALVACVATASCLGAQEVVLAPQQQSTLRRMTPAAVGFAAGATASFLIEKILEAKFDPASTGRKFISRFFLAGICNGIQLNFALKKGLAHIDELGVVSYDDPDFIKYDKGYRAAFFAFALGFYAYHKKMTGLDSSLSLHDLYALICASNLAALAASK